MTLYSSLLFAKRLLFPRTGKKSNARRSLFGSLVCIGISIVPLVVVLTVSNGMIKGITDRMIGLSSSHIQLTLYPNSEYASDAASLCALADSAKSYEPALKNVYPELQGIALASSEKGRFGAAIRAVEKDIFEQNDAFKNLFEVLDGTTDLSAKNSCVLGKKLAENLGVKAGGTVRIITTKENASGKIMPKVSVLTVSGIVSSGYQELDSLWLFLPLEAGFSLLSSSSAVAVLGFETADAFSVELEKTYRSLSALFSSVGRLYRWSDLNVSQYENFASTQIMLLFIMVLIVLVASVNISSALVMLVIERRKEIAILKSLGGTTGGIAVSFMITGTVTGFFGLLFGLPVGILASVYFGKLMSFIERIVNFFARIFHFVSNGNLSDYADIHLLDEAFYLQNVQVIIPEKEIALIAFAVIFLSFLVSVIPAIKAGREKTIEILRKI